MKMYYKTHKKLTWVQNEGLSVHFKFWVQDKNESIWVILSKVLQKF